MTRIHLTCLNAFEQAHAATLILVAINQAYFYCLLNERRRQAIGFQSAAKIS